MWPGRVESSYPYTEGGDVRWPDDTEWPDAWVVAGAVLQATSTLRYATNVYLPTLRDPTVVAKAVGTAAVLSEDRVALGVGGGWLQEEFTALDKEFAGRGKLLDESLQAVRSLLTGTSVSETDGHRAVGGVTMLPAPRRPVPIWVGGLSAPAVRRAIRHDGWIGVLGKDVGATAAQVRDVRRRREESTTKDALFTIMLTGYTDDLDVINELHDAGVDGIFLTPGRFSRKDGGDRHAAIGGYADRILSKLP
jgi:alkanesulfonate monooxygenase SsuD/methylene tetrahydromethanopterin reductase-like flavin-dependent oxidoreductase (luciferase family)